MLQNYTYPGLMRIIRGLIIEKKHYEKNGYKIEFAQTGFGWLYNNLGKIDKKKELLEICLPLYKENYGLEHEYTKHIIKNLEELKLKTASAFSFSNNSGYLEKSGSPIYSQESSNDKKSQKGEEPQKDKSNEENCNNVVRDDAQNSSNQSLGSHGT